MALDPTKNFCEVTVSTGYDASALSVVLTEGHGASLPAPSTDGAFNLVYWNATDYNMPSLDPNKEIVRVTARTTDTLTITRGQEGTSAANHNTANKTYKMTLALTAKMFTDINTMASKVLRVPFTWTIPGEIKVPSGDTDFINPMFVKLATGQTAKLAMARYIINSGTSATVKIQINGSDATGFTGMTVGTTVGETDATDISLAANDKIAIVITGVSATPKNMSFTIFIDYYF